MSADTPAIGIFTAADLSQVIISTGEQYLAQGLAPSLYEINNGLCDDFAVDVVEKLTDKGSIGIYCCDHFRIGEDGDEEGSDEWDWALLQKHWGIVPPRLFTAKQMNDIDFGYHVWISDGKKHYDCEAPEGVDSFFDLPIYQRYLNIHEHMDALQEEIDAI